MTSMNHNDTRKDICVDKKSPSSSYIYIRVATSGSCFHSEARAHLFFRSITHDSIMIDKTVIVGILIIVFVSYAFGYLIRYDND
jgi:hypothetical protein